MGAHQVTMVEFLPSPSVDWGLLIWIDLIFPSLIIHLCDLDLFC